MCDNKSALIFPRNLPPCGWWNDWEEKICQSHKKAAGRIMNKNKQMGFPLCVQGYLWQLSTSWRTSWLRPQWGHMKVPLLVHANNTFIMWPWSTEVDRLTGLLTQCTPKSTMRQRDNSSIYRRPDSSFTKYRKHVFTWNIFTNIWAYAVSNNKINQTLKEV